MISHLKLLPKYFCNKHKLSAICDIIMTLELVQYDLTVPKVRYFLDLRYGILWGGIQTTPCDGKYEVKN